MRVWKEVSVVVVVVVVVSLYSAEGSYIHFTLININLLTLHYVNQHSMICVYGTIFSSIV